MLNLRAEGFCCAEGFCWVGLSRNLPADPGLFAVCGGHGGFDCVREDKGLVCISAFVGLEPGRGSFNPRLGI